MAGQTISQYQSPSLWQQFTHGIANAFNGINTANASMPQRDNAYNNLSSSFPQLQPYASDTSTSNTPAATTDSTNNGSASSTTGTNYSPYQQGMLNAFGPQKQNIYSTADEATNAVGPKLGGSILDFIDQLRGGQTNIDRQATQNELSRLQGTAGVRSMVGQGIRSGGVVLANKNASNSSAGEGLAKAYSTLGQGEMAKVGNQYAQGQNAVSQTQHDFGLQQAAGVRNLGLSKEEAVNGIVSSARNSLAQLDAMMAQASLPERINIEQEKQTIKDKVMASLQQYDQQLNQGVAGIAPTTDEARRLEANRLATAGMAPDTNFSFTSQEPTQFQNTGPFASGLPIFTFPKKRTA